MNTYAVTIKDSITRPTFKASSGREVLKHINKHHKKYGIDKRQIGHLDVRLTDFDGLNAEVLQ